MLIVLYFHLIAMVNMLYILEGYKQQTEKNSIVQIPNCS